MIWTYVIIAAILVIAEFTIPLLAMMALKKIVDEPDLMKKNMKQLYASFALTGGVALLFALLSVLTHFILKIAP